MSKCDVNQVLVILKTSTSVRSVFFLSQSTEVVESKVVIGLTVAGDPYSPFH